MTWSSCVNCGATRVDDDSRCRVCNLHPETRDGAVILLAQSVRDVELGGLLELVRTGSALVPLLGRCAGGVFGIGPDGSVSWIADVGYVTSVRVVAQRLYVNDVEIDLPTGSTTSR